MEYLGKRKSGIEEAPLQDDLMLFEPETSRFFVLNPTMAVVWKHCDGEADLEQAADALMERFSGIDKHSAVTDLKEARETLVEMGLVE